MEFYNQNVLDHFNNPRNTGELANADVELSVGNPECEDYIKVWMRVADDRIERFTYKVFGCAAAIATSSAVSEMVTGMTLNDANKLTDDDVTCYLHGLPEGKEHCSLLGIRAVQQCVLEYRIHQAFDRHQQSEQMFLTAGIDISAVCQNIAERLKRAGVGGEVADIPAYHGFMALALAQNGFSCVAVDKSADRLDHIDRLAAYFNVQDHLLTERENILDSEMQDDSFGAVVSCGGLHRLGSLDKALSELVRICRPGGRLILADINSRGFDLLMKSENTPVPDTQRVYTRLQTHCGQCRLTELDYMYIVEAVV